MPDTTVEHCSDCRTVNHTVKQVVFIFVAVRYK